MASGDETLRTLREALRCSPDNIPLRQLLADTLLGQGRLEEAEKEYREALFLSPQNLQLKIGLAKAFYRQGKNSAALVILEDALKGPNPPAQAHLLYAHLLLRAGEVERAAQAYRKAVDRDPSVADPELAEQLGSHWQKEDRAREDGGEDLEDAEEVRVREPVGEVPLPSDKILEHPKITFKDVGGLEQLKEEIRMKIIHPLTHPELYKAYGKSIGGGLLMYGPPGCGKTYLARATAGEVKAGFLAVGIHEVLEMWLGQSERNLHELFERARNHKPCVLFFDEVDALGASRTDLRHSSGRQIINQFLSELDGVQSSNEGVLILAATNAPWHLDPAFRRPGRFDRILFVPPPDFQARIAILRVLLKGKPVEDIDYDRLAKKTERFSGADLKAVVETAVEAKLREAMKKGAPTPLTTQDLLTAVKTLKPTTPEWFATARNYALYANQGGMYDDILAYLKIS